MGSQIAQVAPSTQPQGKGSASPAAQSAPVEINLPSEQPFPRPQENGSSVTYPGQGGQPKMGVPNNYSNTVGQWDNATIGTQQYQAPQTIQPQQSPNRGGKGKG
jgi:hypothetical protein